MNPEIKEMLSKLTTDELMEVQEVVDELIAVNRDSLAEDDGQPSELQENQDFAKDDDMIPYDE